MLHLRSILPISSIEWCSFEQRPNRGSFSYKGESFPFAPAWSLWVNRNDDSSNFLSWRSGNLVMKWGARIHLEGEDGECSRDLCLSREARERGWAVWSCQMTNTQVWSCYSMWWWSKQRWVWWACSHISLPSPRTHSGGSLSISLRYTVNLLVESLKTEKYVLFGIIKKKRAFYYRRHFRTLYLFCSLFEQQTLNFSLGTHLIIRGDFGHSEFKRETREWLCYWLNIAFSVYPLIFVFSGLAQECRLSKQVKKKAVCTTTTSLSLVGTAALGTWLRWCIPSSTLGVGGWKAALETIMATESRNLMECLSHFC